MANYPTSASTDANLFIAKNNLATTLNGATNNSATTITVVSTTDFPTAGYITIDSEAILYSGTNGTQFTGCTRGADGTTAVSHADLATAYHYVVAAHHNNLKDEVIALETDLLSSTGLMSLKSTNLLPRGGFDTWNGQTAFTDPANNAYIFDNWRLEADTAVPTSASISKDTGVYDLSPSSLKIIVTTVGTCTRYFLYNTQANYLDYAGKTISLSVRVKTSIANKVRAYIDSTGATYSSYHTGSGNWETLTITKTIGASPTYVDLAIGFVDNGNVTAGTVYIDSMMLVYGSVPSAFVPDSPTTTELQSLSQSRATNILINGGMEFWQRGTSFSNPAHTTYTADRWKVNTNEASTVTVTQESTNVDIGLYSFKVVTSGTTASKIWYISQTMENFEDYRGKTITITARVKTSVAGAVKVSLNDDTTTVDSSYHSGSGNFETLSAKLAVSSTTTGLRFSIGMINSGDKKDGTFYFDSLMAVFGSIATPFVPKNITAELAECQRYFFKTFNQSVAPAQNTGSNPGVLAYSIHTAGIFNDVATIAFPVVMRTIPTIITYSVGAASSAWYNISSGAASGAATVLGTLSARTADVRNAQAAGDAISQLPGIHLTADAEI